MPVIPERFKWAASLMDPQPAQHLLEIGCGTGLLASLLAKDLSSGSCTCIDRSAAMISKAKKNNRQLITEKNLFFREGQFPEMELKKNHYHLVAAFNVNVFMRPDPAPFQAVKHLLAKNGRFFIFHQAPYEINKSAADPIVSTLLKNGFTIRQVLLKKLHPVSAIAVEAVAGQKS